MENEIRGGAFQVARQIFSSDIWLNKPATWKIIWIYILGKVNHKDNGKFKRGEGFFNLTDEKRNIGIDIKYNTIRHAMVWLRGSDMIRTTKSTRGVIIKVLNYDKYQTLDNFKSTTQSKVKAQSKHNKSTTINKNVKNDKNEKNLCGLKDYLGFLHDGTPVIKKYGRWCLKENENTNIDASYYPEILKDEILKNNPLKI